MHIGFIGTGTISGAMVEGLCLKRPETAIVVSPRSEAVSLRLAAAHANVRRAASNAEVAECPIVVLGMRPAQVTEALAGLAFRPEQLVISLVAGLSFAALRELLPQPRLARATPMPGIARAIGPVSVTPDLPELVEIFGPLGELFVTDEARLSMGGLGTFMSSYFELQQRLIGVGMAAGASENDARRYAVSLLAMLADTARITPPEGFATLVEEHQTKGGLNERVRAELLAEGWFDAVPRALGRAGGLDWRRLG